MAWTSPLLTPCPVPLGAVWPCRVVVPRVLPEMINDPDVAKSQRAMAAMLSMKKIDIDALKRAYAGEQL